MLGGTYSLSYRYDSVLPVVHAYGFFWRYRAIKDIAQITSYRDAIGAPCIRAQTVMTDVRNIKTNADDNAGKRACRNLRRNEPRQRAKKYRIGPT